MQLIGNVLLGADKEVAEWVGARISHVGHQGFGLHSAIGVMRHGKPVAGAVYHGFGGHIVEVSFAAEHGSRWASRSVLRALFAYPFHQLGCVVMVARTAKRNRRARKLLRALGFQETGMVPKGLDGKRDAIIYCIEKDNCRWLKGHLTHG
jgi:RimJ/RimL family protein N-acetyltransferase